jgi:hypothetical protein
MKLFLDVIHLLTAGLQNLARARGTPSSRIWSITVPASRLLRPSGSEQRAIIDMHWHADSTGGRPVAQWHDHPAPQARGHIRMVSND